MIHGPTFDLDKKQLTTLTLPIPELKPTQVLVDVHYAGLNRADAQQAKGKYPPPKGESLILGLECAGVVAKCGSQVTQFKIGDKVMGLVAGGAFGNQVVMDEVLTLAAIPHLSLAECATLPESLFTFWVNAAMDGGLKSGQRFLCHGGAAGLGSFSVIMAGAMGAHVTTTARGASRCEFVKSLGANHVIDTENKDIDAIKSELLATGADFKVILDHIGHDYFPMHIEALAKLGTLILINNVGDRFTQLDIASLFTKRLRVIGSMLRARSLEEKSAISHDLRARALPLIESKKLKFHVDSIIDIANLPEAIARLESRKNLGKIVLKI